MERVLNDNITCSGRPWPGPSACRGVGHAGAGSVLQPSLPSGTLMAGAARRAGETRSSAPGMDGQHGLYCSAVSLTQVLPLALAPHRDVVPGLAYGQEHGSEKLFRPCLARREEAHAPPPRLHGWRA
jgi:hypothetical protein